MSRKNNKSIKKRYNDHLKTVERKELEKKSQKEFRKQQNEAINEANQLLQDLGLDQAQNKMDVEKVKKIKKIKKHQSKQQKRKRMK